MFQAQKWNNTKMLVQTSQLSVVVPITGSPSRIINLLRWLPNFSALNGEVILVHDVFDDQTTEILVKNVEELKKTMNITLIEGKFGSPGAARNAGKKVAQSTWVTFWDCDDMPNLQNIKKELDESSNQELDFICGGFEVIDLLAQLPITQHLNSGNVSLDKIDVGLNPGIWRFLFKKNSIKDISFLEISMAEDQDFLLDYNLSMRHGFFSRRIFYHYYIGDNGQLTREKSAFDDLQISLKHIKEIRKSRGADNYLEIIHIRQILTGIRHARFGMKLYFSYCFLLKLFDFTNVFSRRAFRQVVSPSKRKLIKNV